MIAALIHLIIFTMFMFFCILGASVFLIVQFVKKHPSAAMYWSEVLKRILGW